MISITDVSMRLVDSLAKYCYLSRIHVQIIQLPKYTILNCGCQGKSINRRGAAHLSPTAISIRQPALNSFVTLNGVLGAGQIAAVFLELAETDGIHENCHI